jgi:membrane protease subunit (stomatin/prohibitin family)
MRGYGIYSYHVADPKNFYQKISGTRDLYHVADLEGQLRNTIVAVMTNTFASSAVPFLDLAGNQIEMGNRIMEHMKPAFADLGLTLDTFVVDNVSLPDELQQMLDQRISMNIVGDMNKFTQFQVAKSIPIAAANEGGGGVAGIGVGLGAGLTMGQQMMNAMQGGGGPAAPPAAGPSAPPSGPAAPAGPSEPGATPAAAASETKFCMNCGKHIPRPAKFCPECGTAQ